MPRMDVDLPAISVESLTKLYKGTQICWRYMWYYILIRSLEKERLLNRSSVHDAVMIIIWDAISSEINSIKNGSFTSATKENCIHRNG